MSQSLQDLETQGNHYMSRRGLNMRALIRVAAYIEDNLGERFTLDALANAACMSRFHFARMFRLSTGCSPMTYVLERRIEWAKKLLDSSNRSVSDIAAELGFCDHSHFTRIFGRIIGVTPKEYKRRNEVGIDASFPETSAGVPSGKFIIEHRPSALLAESPSASGRVAANRGFSTRPAMI